MAGFIFTYIYHSFLLMKRSGVLVSCVAFYCMCFVVISFFCVKSGVDSFASVCWVSALFTMQKIGDDMFAEDYRNGMMEQYWFHILGLKYAVWFRVLSSWIVIGPLVSLLSTCMIALHYNNYSNIILWFSSSLVGTLIMHCIGSACAALLVGARSAGMIAYLLTTPVSLPVLGFGALSYGIVDGGQYFLMLLALMVLMVPISLGLSAYAIESVLVE